MLLDLFIQSEKAWVFTASSQLLISIGVHLAELDGGVDLLFGLLFAGLINFFRDLVEEAENTGGESQPKGYQNVLSCS